MHNVGFDYLEMSFRADRMFCSFVALTILKHALVIELILCFGLIASFQLSVITLYCNCHLMQCLNYVMLITV